jgi:hypothetical protein
MSLWLGKALLSASVHVLSRQERYKCRLIERGKRALAVLARMHPDHVESHNAASRFRCPVEC